MNFYLVQNCSEQRNVQMLPMPLETSAVESYVRGYHTYSAVLVATVLKQLQCALERRNAKNPLQWQSLNGSDIVRHIPRKISQNDRHLELCFTKTEC